MKLLVETSIVFFGTLLAAALVALGEPASAEVEMVHSHTHRVFTAAR